MIGLTTHYSSIWGIFVHFHAPFSCCKSIGFQINRLTFIHYILDFSPKIDIPIYIIVFDLMLVPFRVVCLQILPDLHNPCDGIVIFGMVLCRRRFKIRISKPTNVTILMATVWFWSTPVFFKLYQGFLATEQP